MNLEMELDSPPVSRDELERMLEGIIPDTIEIVVTDPGCMRVLNRKYRRIDRSTDVLSFDLADSPDDRPEGVVYVDGRLAPPVSEIIERVLHGYLHLCGLNHDSEEAATEMNHRLHRILDSMPVGRENA